MIMTYLHRLHNIAKRQLAFHMTNGWLIIIIFFFYCKTPAWYIIPLYINQDDKKKSFKFVKQEIVACLIFLRKANLQTADLIETSILHGNEPFNKHCQL